MMARLVVASLRRRGRQLLLLGISVAVAAATVAALTGFAERARQGLAPPFAAFGPNLVVRPQVGGPPALPRGEVAAAMARVDGVEAWAVLAAADAGDGPALVAVAGDVLALHPTWTLTGTWPAPGEVAAGAAVAPASLAGRRVSGTVATGTGLDGALWVPLAPDASVGRVEVRADRERVDAVAAAIEVALPGSEARPLASVTRAERDLVRRLTLILGLASLVACGLAVITVGAAATALVEQRRVEVGLFLALGFTGPRVARLFAVELLAAAALAGLAGELVGEMAGMRLAGRVVEAAAIALAPGWGLVTAPAAALAVVGLAMVVALRRVESTDPARVLAGE